MALSTTISSHAQNLISNYSFESGYSNWTTNDASIAVYSSGTTNVCHTDVAWINPNNENDATNYAYQRVSASSGNDYILSFTALDYDVAGTRRGYIRALNSSNSVLSQSYVNITGGRSAGFKQYATSLSNTPSGTSKIEVYFEATHEGAIKVDCVELTQGQSWEFDCGDNKEVTIHYKGTNGSNPDVVSIPSSSEVYEVVAEVVYKGTYPGSSITASANGSNFTLPEVTLTGTSSNVYAYRGTYTGSASSVSLVNAPQQSSLQSLVVYAFRNVENGAQSSGTFTSISGYRTTVDFDIPIPTDNGPRDVFVELPISEITYDCRVLDITVTAGSVVETYHLAPSTPTNGCCVEVPSLTLNNVSGGVNNVNVEVVSPSGSSSSCPDSGPGVQNGQSFVIAGAIMVDVECFSGADYGDAPDSYGDINYAVDCGSPAQLGNNIDSENGSQHSANADGDDSNGLDDEDGVFFSGGDPTFEAGVDKYVTIDYETYDADSYISAWVDWNRDGVFQSGEIAIDDVQVGSGTMGTLKTGSVNYGIKTPNSISCGPSFIRVIITSDPNEGPTGLYADDPGCNDGEVEDYAVTLEDNPEVTASVDHPACGENNGSITFSFNNNPNQSTIEFSINGGSSFPYSSPDNAGSFTVENLGPGSYHLVARWQGSTCETDLGTYTLTDDQPTCETCYAIAENSDGKLYGWNIGGTTNLIGTLGAPNVESMALNFDGTVLYAMDKDQLGTVNLSTGAFTPLGSPLGTMYRDGVSESIDDVDGLAIDSESGLLFAIERKGSSDDILFKINPVTADFVPDAFGAGKDYVVVNSSNMDIDDIAFSPIDNKLYGVSTVSGSGTNDIIIEIDMNTGMPTTVATLPTCDIEGLTFNNAGEMFGTTGADDCQVANDRGVLYKINTSNSTVERIAQFGHTDVEAVACFVSAPNPCDNLTDGGQIGYDQDFCGSSYDPDPIINVVSPSGGSGTIEYLWLRSTVTCEQPSSINDPDWEIIPGATSDSYDPGTITQNTCYIRCSRRENCEEYVGESNIVEILLLNDPTVTIDPAGPFCENDGPVQLSGTPSGGTFSGPGVSPSGSFDPGTAGVGSHVITYSYTDGNGCLSSSHEDRSQYS